MNANAVVPIEILLVEDNPADVRLTNEVLKDAHIANHVSVAHDGEEAMAFLLREGDHADSPRPDLILLDLNLPRKDGREVLAEIKSNGHDLHKIPVVVMTTSAAEVDVLAAYDSHVNAYVTKPFDLDQFITVVKAIEEFWLAVVRLPENK